MIFFIIGFIAGSALNFFVFFDMAGSVITPEWTVPISAGAAMPGAVIKSEGNPSYTAASDTYVKIFSGDGIVTGSKEVKDSLLESSGNGKFYVTYKQTGKSMELFGIKGERYWQMNSREYPYLSNSAKLILMLNGDHSAVRILDLNGKEGPGRLVSGRLCNVIAFSETDDHGAVGFIDGTFSFIGSNGQVIYSGRVPDGAAVKSIAVSSNGKFGAVHGGDHQSDSLHVINIADDKSRKTDIGTKHITTTALHVDDNGNAVLIDKKRIASWSSGGSLNFEIAVPEKRDGFASLSVKDGRVLAGYTDVKGSSRVYLINTKGEVLLSKDFSNESFMDVSLSGNRLFLRGSERLYCYSVY
jgi:hypothetical protein